MPFYSQWYEQSVCLRGSDGTINHSGESMDDVSASAVQVDLTPIQVTVSSVKDRLVYNVEYKPSEIKTSLDKTISGKRSSSERSVAFTELKTSSHHVGAAANAVAARFVHQNHSRSHSRQGSSVSDMVFTTADRISSDSLWKEDWIVEYLHKDANAAAEEPSMEEWIFETM